MKTHKIMIIAEVMENADYGVIRDAIGDFPEVVNVEAPECYLGRHLFMLVEEDAQIVAKRHIGRKLSEEELGIAKKGLECGLGCWAEVMEAAIDEATGYERLKYVKKEKVDAKK